MPACVCVGSVVAVDILHCLGKIAFRRFHKETISVVQECEGMENQAVPSDGVIKNFEKPAAVDVVLKQHLIGQSLS